MTDAPSPDKSERRNPAPYILLAAGSLLVIYYLIVAFSGILQNSTAVRVDGQDGTTGSTYLTLRMSIQDVDLTNRVIQANVLPVPHGELLGAKAGEISESLRIEVSSGGVTTSVVTFPGESVIDATALSLTLDRGDTDYPFDHPFADYQLSVQNDETGLAVPFVLEISNSARPWQLTADRGPAASEGERTLYPVTIEGSRDVLSIALVMFYVVAILLTTLMAVVIIGSAILRRRLEFSNVIWLSATLLSFPALRSSMPGAPPIGTALDFIVLFPCLCLIAAMLIWTGTYLLWRESSVLRAKVVRVDDDSSAPAAELS